MWDNAIEMPASTPTLAHYLRDRGYHTVQHPDHHALPAPASARLALDTPAVLHIEKGSRRLNAPTHPRPGPFLVRRRA